MRFATRSMNPLLPHGMAWFFRIESNDSTLQMPTSCRLGRFARGSDDECERCHRYMIRFATTADANRIAEIHVATWRDAYRGIVPDSFLASMSVEEHVARWRGRIEANAKLVFVHEHEGRIDGFVSMGAGRDVDAKTDGEIYALYIASESWRNGIGRALMEKAEEELQSRGLNRIVLWVLGRNDRARRFYGSVGYAPEGRTKETTIGDTVLTELRYEKRK